MKTQWKWTNHTFCHLFGFSAVKNKFRPHLHKVNISNLHLFKCWKHHWHSVLVFTGCHWVYHLCSAAIITNPHTFHYLLFSSCDFPICCRHTDSVLSFVLISCNLRAVPQTGHTPLMEHMLFVSTQFIYKVCVFVYMHVCQCTLLEKGLKCIKRLNQTIMTFKSKHKTICKGGENGNGQMETGTSLVRGSSAPGFRVAKPAHT